MGRTARGRAIRAASLLAAAAVVAVLAIPSAPPGTRRTPEPADLVPADPGVFLSWALLDRRTGVTVGTRDRDTGASSTESMIKMWIAADQLRLATGSGAAGPPQPDLAAAMIRDSDDAAAEEVYRSDGADDVVRRMISICGLTGTGLVSGTWAGTEITATDATRLGLCVADGRAAGPWTGWILDQMRQVRGEGRFGIIEALPPDVAATTAIKNGWTVVGDGQWHVTCLAIQDRWILAVLTRYQAARGLGYGAGLCATVARRALAGR